MPGMERITIEDRVYSINKLNPLDGLEYGVKVAGAISQPLGGMVELFKEEGNINLVGAELSKLFKDPQLVPILHEALKQCFTPKNESLANEATFQKHFSDYPQDMFALGVQAAYILAKDFFPSPLATIVSGWQEKIQKHIPKAE